MISCDLVDLVRRFPGAERYQCAYRSKSGPQRIGCAIQANGRQLDVLSVHISPEPNGRSHFYGIVETVAIDQMTALAEPDQRVGDAIDALLEYRPGSNDLLTEIRLRDWAELNANLVLVDSGFDVRLDMPALMIQPNEVSLSGSAATAAKR